MRWRGVVKGEIIITADKATCAMAEIMNGIIYYFVTERILYYTNGGEGNEF